MSDAEKKKLEELKKIKTQKPKAEVAEKKEKVKVEDSLPPLMMGGRKGQFDLIPDFLKQKEIKKDLGLVNEFDMMESLNRKQY